MISIPRKEKKRLTGIYLKQTMYFCSVFTHLREFKQYGLMISELDSGSNGPGSRPGQGHCVVFLNKTLSSHSESLHPGV